MLVLKGLEIKFYCMINKRTMVLFTFAKKYRRVPDYQYIFLTPTVISRQRMAEYISGRQLYSGLHNIFSDDRNSDELWSFYFYRWSTSELFGCLSIAQGQQIQTSSTQYNLIYKRYMQM